MSEVEKLLKLQCEVKSKDIPFENLHFLYSRGDSRKKLCLAGLIFHSVLINIFI